MYFCLLKSWSARSRNPISLPRRQRHLESQCNKTKQHLFHVLCKSCNYIKFFNPLTAVLATTGCDERWPLFHFCRWRHHLSPKLASSERKLSRRERSSWWYPEQSDWLSGAWNIHENAPKFDSKIQSKIACNYTWLLNGKICPCRQCFLRIFLNKKQA